MTARDNEIERFRLLLTADARLTDAGVSLQQAGLAAGDIAKLRSKVARSLQALQDAVYDGIAPQ
ncbi:MAG TPA: hypothetical protein VN932_10540 [Rhizomicrobium sp.]|nr:hypothetical protein [Rhizomicrobium sp.]